MKNKPAKNKLLQHLMKVALLSILTVSPAHSSVCEEPFARPSYLSRSKVCTVGEYVNDSYAPGSRVRCEEMELDHLVSLRQAWESGVCGEDLKKFANDPLNLRPTHWRTNRSKGQMSPLLFSERLDGSVANTVRGDALTVMRKYGILTRRELFEQAYKAQISRMATLTVPFSKLPDNAGRYTLKKAGEKTLVFMGKRVVGTITVVGGAYSAVEVSAWSYRHLFIPDRDQATKDRAAQFEEIINALE